MTPVLAAGDVTFSYGARAPGAGGGAPALEGVTFELGRGEVLGVVGPNSSGKTTLVRLLSKVHAPDRGEIRLGGVPIGRITREALARQVAVVPQELSVAFPLTVEELCLMGRYPHDAARLFEAPRDVERAREAMRLAGVLDLARRPLDMLAGGERQRALLARALAQEPRVLLLDEPTSQLDLRHQREIVGLLRRLNRDQGLAILFVSHDLNLAGELADRLLLLVHGRVAQLGPPADVLDAATLEAAYGCPVWVEKSRESGRPVVHVRWE